MYVHTTVFHPRRLLSACIPLLCKFKVVGSTSSKLYYYLNGPTQCQI